MHAFPVTPERYRRFVHTARIQDIRIDYDIAGDVEIVEIIRLKRSAAVIQRGVQNFVHQNEFKLGIGKRIYKVGAERDPHPVRVSGLTHGIERKLHMQKQYGVKRLLLHKRKPCFLQSFYYLQRFFTEHYRSSVFLF